MVQILLKIPIYPEVFNTISISNLNARPLQLNQVGSTLT